MDIQRGPKPVASRAACQAAFGLESTAEHAALVWASSHHSYMDIDNFCADQTIEIGKMQVDFEAAMKVAPGIAARAYCEHQMCHDLTQLFVLVGLLATEQGLVFDAPDLTAQLR